MSSIMHVCFAITAAVFAAIFLVAIIVFGDVWARNIAIGAAFLACASQFTGQDDRAYRVSRYFAWAAFAAALVAYACLIIGR